MVKSGFFLTFRGFTLVELMVALLLISLVFLAGISVYTTGFRFLRVVQNTDVTMLPVVSVEDIAKRVSLSNVMTTSAPGAPVVGAQLNVCGDYQLCTYTPLNTPNNFADDNCWHYAFMNTNELKTSCNNNANAPVTPAGTTLINNVNTVLSSFTLVNPSASGNATVAHIHVRTTVPPVAELDTDVALGASAKR